MDNSTELSWAPPAGLAVLAWVLTAATGGFAVLIDDAPGRVLLVLGAGTLALIALFMTVARPRLTAGAHGVTVRGLTGSRRWGWPDVTVRLARSRRLGRETYVLELDVTDEGGMDDAPGLVVLGWFDLGAHPTDVVEQLHRLRP